MNRFPPRADVRHGRLSLAASAVRLQEAVWWEWGVFAGEIETPTHPHTLTSMRIEVERWDGGGEGYIDRG